MIYRPMETDSWFNAQLLKSLRAELGWTQLGLAERSNLSVRVIAKAEAGKRVARRTTRALVQTLTAAGKVVSFDDFVRDPRMIAQQLLNNCAKHGIDGVSLSRELLDPNIEVHMDGDAITNPFAGTYRGFEEFEAMLQKYYSVFVRDGGTLGDLSQMRLVGTEVIAWGHEYIRVPEAPPCLPSFVMVCLRYAGGLITRIDQFYDAPGLMSRVEAWAKAYPHASWIQYFDLHAISHDQRRRRQLYNADSLAKHILAANRNPPTRTQ